MAFTGARVPEMENYYFGVTTLPESANFLHTENTREDDVGCLASLPHRPGRRFPHRIGRG